MTNGNAQCAEYGSSASIMIPPLPSTDRKPYVEDSMDCLEAVVGMLAEAVIRLEMRLSPCLEAALPGELNARHLGLINKPALAERIDSSKWKLVALKDTLENLTERIEL